MKRIARILSLTAVLLLVALLIVPVSAAAESADPYGRVHDPNAPRIVDNKAFPPDFAKTVGACPHANDCRHCGRCAEVLSRVLVQVSV